MTIEQAERIKEFEIEAESRGENPAIDWKESNSPESLGCLFGDFNGVTLMVYPKGLINVPAVCSYHPPKYPTPIIAAVSAKELWGRQRTRDELFPDKAYKRKGG